MKTETVRGYAHWASYFINGDASSFDYYASDDNSAEDQIAEADRWLEWAIGYVGAEYGPSGLAEDSDGNYAESYFARPEGPFGLLPGDCVDYVFLVKE